MLADKNPYYKGPKSHRAIVKLIHEEIFKEHSDRLKYRLITRVILILFNQKGIAGLFKLGLPFKIYAMGTFIPKDKSIRKAYIRREREKREKQREYVRINNRKITLRKRNSLPLP